MILLYTKPEIINKTKTVLSIKVKILEHKRFMKKSTEVVIKAAEKTEAVTGSTSTSTTAVVPYVPPVTASKDATSSAQSNVSSTQGNSSSAIEQRKKAIEENIFSRKDKPQMLQKQQTIVEKAKEAFVKKPTMEEKESLRIVPKFIKNITNFFGSNTESGIRQIEQITTKTKTTSDLVSKALEIHDPFSGNNEVQNPRKPVIFEQEPKILSESKHLYYNNQEIFKQGIPPITNPIIEHIVLYTNTPSLFINGESFKEYSKHILKGKRFNIPFTNDENKINNVVILHVEQTVAKVPDEEPTKELKRCHTPEDYVKAIDKTEQLINYLIIFTKISFKELVDIGEKAGFIRIDKTNLNHTLEPQLTQPVYDLIALNPERYGVQFSNTVIEPDVILDLYRKSMFEVIIDDNLYPNAVMRHSSEIHKSLLMKYPKGDGTFIYLKVGVLTSSIDEGTIILSKTQETNSDPEQQKKQQRYRQNRSIIEITKEQYEKSIKDIETTRNFQGLNKEGEPIYDKMYKHAEQTKEIWLNNKVQKPLIITRDVLYKVSCDILADTKESLKREQTELNKILSHCQTAEKKKDILDKVTYLLLSF